MTMPIHPPGGGSGPPEGPGKPGGPGGPGAAGSTEGPSRAEGGFQEALDPAAGPDRAAPGAPAEALGQVVEDLRAGRIDPAQAVEQLVERALEAPEARALSETLRGELEAHLRRTLADDPALAALVRDLERGR